MQILLQDYKNEIEFTKKSTFAMHPYQILLEIAN